MALSPESLYMQLCRLVETMPDLFRSEPLDADTQMWLARASALIRQTGIHTEIALINVAVSSFYVSQHQNAQTIISVVYRALANAELSAPAAMQGAFIAAGNTVDAFAAFGKVVSHAKTDVLIVDPYMDAVAVTDFAVLAPDGVAIRLLADKDDHKPTLKPAVKRWPMQFKTRPLEARLSSPRTLHDRLILVDGKDVWNLSQSLNAIASRAHASISRFDSDTAAMKRTAYEELWQSATPI